MGAGKLENVLHSLCTLSLSKITLTLISINKNVGRQVKYRIENRGWSYIQGGLGQVVAMELNSKQVLLRGTINQLSEKYVTCSTGE